MTTHSMKTIYAIRDRIANDLAGYFPLVVFRTDAQAIRYFHDSIFQGEKSALAAHPADYELISCGHLEDDGTINGFETKIIITGDAIVAVATDHQPKLVKDA